MVQESQRRGFVKIPNFRYNNMVTSHIKIKKGRDFYSKKFDNDSLSHTRWNCKYHIVFVPKYRRQIIYGKIKTDVDTVGKK